MLLLAYQRATPGLSLSTVIDCHPSGFFRHKTDDGEVFVVQEDTAPCPRMPHLMYSASEFDTRQPALVARLDEDLADVAEGGRVGIYKHGLGLAGEIRA